MQKLFKNVSYHILALVCALFIFLLISWFPAFGLWITFLQNATSFGEGFWLTYNLFSLALLDSPLPLTTFNLLVSLLVGVNTALLTYYWTHFRTPSTATGLTSGVFGTLITFLGFGCASCGTLFLTFLLTSVGATGLTALPIFNSYILQGVGILLLLFSIYKIYRKTQDPLVCY